MNRISDKPLRNVNLSLPGDLGLRFRQRCQQEGKGLSEVGIHLLEYYVATGRTPGPPRVTIPPGGPRDYDALALVPADYREAFAFCCEHLGLNAASLVTQMVDESMADFLARARERRRQRQEFQDDWDGPAPARATLPMDREPAPNGDAGA